MPYSNMPESEWANMDKCVNDVMDQGHDKPSAIAICHTSIMGKKSVSEAMQMLKDGKIDIGAINAQKSGARHSSEDRAAIRQVRTKAKEIHDLSVQLEESDSDEPAAKSDWQGEVYNILTLEVGGVKATGDWTLDVLGVPFGGPLKGKDIDGQYFSEKTNLHLELMPEIPVYYYHGRDPNGKPMGEPVIVGKAKFDHKDSKGYWFKAVLNQALDLAKRVWEAAKAGMARASSDSASQYVRLNQLTGEITNWPLIGISVFDADGKRQPANAYAVAMPAAKMMFENAGMTMPVYPEDNEPQAPAEGPQNQPGANAQASLGTKSAKGVLEMETKEINDLIGAALKADREARAVEEKAAKDQQAVVDAAVEAAKAKWEAEAAKGRRLPGGGGPLIAQFADTNKYDGLSAADLGVMIDMQRGLHGAAASRGLDMPDVSASAVKALMLKVARLGEDKESHQTQGYAQGALKAMIGSELTDPAIKAATDPMYNYTSIGTEWVGTAYSNQLWEKIRAAAVVAAKIPSVVIPDGYNNEYFPLDGADPTFYKVAEVSAANATTGIPDALVTASQSATDRKQITVAKMGARTMYSGELTEDSLINFAPQLRSQLELGGTEQMEHVIIDGDTATSSNINDIGGTTYSGAATTLFLLTNGFRKVGIANGRSAAGSLSEDDYLLTMQLLGLNGIAADVSKCSFIVGPNTYFKSLRLSTLKTKDAWSTPTLEGGVLTQIWGYPVMRSFFMHWRQTSRKANTAGKVDLTTVGNNLYGAILAVRWDQWKLAYKRRMTMETTRFANSDSWEIVALTRWGLGYRDAYAASESYYVGI